MPLRSHRIPEVLAVCVGLLMSGSLLAASADYEDPPSLKASDVLPAEMQHGEHFGVEQEVKNDGFMNHYVVTSDYGDFTAYGNLSLDRLIREIAAIAQLEELSRSKEFLRQAATVATGQIKTVGAFAKAPVKTAKGVPSGVKGMFRKYKRQAKEGYQTAKDVSSDVADAVVPGEDGEGEGGEGADSNKSDASELAGSATDAATEYAKHYFGLNSAEQRWYQKLRIDPYTRNVALRTRVHKVARVDAAATFGVKLAPIPSIPGVNYVGKINHLVWTVDPEQLRADNIKRLHDAGISKVLTDRFMDNRNLSPSQQTVMLSTLNELELVKGRQTLLDLAAEAESVEEGEFTLANTVFLSVYHQIEEELQQILSGAPVPVALTRKSGLLIIVSADYVFWEEDLGEAVTLMAEAFADQPATSREIWIRGQASPRFEEEVEALGWGVREMIDLTDKVKEEMAPPAPSGRHDY